MNGNRVSHPTLEMPVSATLGQNRPPTSWINTVPLSANASTNTLGRRSLGSSGKLNRQSHYNLFYWLIYLRQNLIKGRFFGALTVHFFLNFSAPKQAQNWGCCDEGFHEKKKLNPLLVGESLVHCDELIVRWVVIQVTKLREIENGLHRRLPILYSRPYKPMVCSWVVEAGKYGKTSNWQHNSWHVWD